MHFTGARAGFFVHQRPWKPSSWGAMRVRPGAERIMHQRQIVVVVGRLAKSNMRMDTTEELRAENHRLRSELQAYMDREERVARLRGRLGRWFLRAYMGGDLRGALDRLVAEARSHEPISSDAIAWTVAALVQRVVRVGIITVLVAFSGSLIGGGLLTWQNIEIRAQTQERIEQGVEDAFEQRLAYTISSMEQFAVSLHPIAADESIPFAVCDRLDGSPIVREAIREASSDKLMMAWRVGERGRKLRQRMLALDWVEGVETPSGHADGVRGTPKSLQALLLGTLIARRIVEAAANEQ